MGIFDIRDPNITIRGQWPLLRKARENLWCAVDAAGHKWYNSSASRLYYALYQAGTEFLTAKGESYDPDPYWKHQALCHRVSYRTQGKYGNFLLSIYQLRTTADYHGVNIKPKQVTTHFGEAWAFLTFVYQDLRQAGVRP